MLKLDIVNLLSSVTQKLQTDKSRCEIWFKVFETMTSSQLRALSNSKFALTPILLLPASHHFSRCIATLILGNSNWLWNKGSSKQPGIINNLEMRSAENHKLGSHRYLQCFFSTSLQTVWIVLIYHARCRYRTLKQSTSGHAHFLKSEGAGVEISLFVGNLAPVPHIKSSANNISEARFLKECFVIFD